MAMCAAKVVAYPATPPVQVDDNGYWDAASCVPLYKVLGYEDLRALVMACTACERAMENNRPGPSPSKASSEEAKVRPDSRQQAVLSCFPATAWSVQLQPCLCTVSQAGLGLRREWERRPTWAGSLLGMLCAASRQSSCRRLPSLPAHYARRFGRGASWAPSLSRGPGR